MCIFNLVLHEVFFFFFFPFRVTQEAIHNSLYLATFTVYCIFFFLMSISCKLVFMRILAKSRWDTALSKWSILWGLMEKELKPVSYFSSSYLRAQQSLAALCIVFILLPWQSNLCPVCCLHFRLCIQQSGSLSVEGIYTLKLVIWFPSLPVISHGISGNLS